MSPKQGPVAGDVMTGGTQCVDENDNLVEAAKKLARLDVEALPICGKDGQLKGVITEGDIVARGLALDKDPTKTKAGEYGYGKPVTIGADDALESALKTMHDHNVRRLPVIDGGSFVGVISQEDIVSKMEVMGGSTK